MIWVTLLWRDWMCISLAAGRFFQLGANWSQLDSYLSVRALVVTSWLRMAVPGTGASLSGVSKSIKLPYMVIMEYQRSARVKATRPLYAWLELTQWHFYLFSLVETSQKPSPDSKIEKMDCTSHKRKWRAMWPFWEVISGLKRKWLT